MIVFPNAKINLGLNIVGVRPDGYHDIETIFVPIGYSDALELVFPNEQVEGGVLWQSSGNQLDVPLEKNLCVKALRALQAEADLPTVSMMLHKVIPSGAGLGGGSSDAAFVLTTLNNLLNLNIPHERLLQIAARLGADCPFFIDGKPVFASGIGDVFSPINLPNQDLNIVVAIPQGSVSTAEAYRDIPCRKPTRHLYDIISDPISTWKDSMVNDFEDYVAQRLPDVAAFKQKFYDMGALYAQMSGSGSSVFALFEDHVELPTANDFPTARGFYSGHLNI